MNYPETPSAKIGSPFLPYKTYKTYKTYTTYISLQSPSFLDIRQQSLLKNHNFNDFTNLS